MYSPFDPGNNASIQAAYRAQIANVVFTDANRKDGDIRLRSNPRNIYTYLILFLFVGSSPLFYLFMFEDVSIVVGILAFLPALFVLGLVVHAIFKLRTILINEETITVKAPLRRKRVYSYDRIESISCFPPAKVPAGFMGNVPLQNVMVVTFDDKKSLRLPVMMPGYAELFGFFSANTRFESELSKVVQYYFRFGLDIKNRRVVQENVFSGMDDQNPGSSGSDANSGSNSGSDANSGSDSDPNNPFNGF